MNPIVISLSHESVRSAINQLEQKRRDISVLTRSILNSLLQIGIKAGEENTGQYAGYISFSAFVERDGVGNIGLLIARDRQKIVREWRYRGGNKTAEVSPLLMAEFGSGWFAEVLPTWKSVVGEVGQGTFPGQKHAFDPGGWHWVDADGTPHHSYGEHPTYPVHSAWLAMKSAIDETAREQYLSWLGE